MLLLTLLSSASLAGVTVSERLSSVVRPTAQRIDLDLDPADPRFTATTTITFDIPKGEKVEGFSLHAEGLDVRPVALRRMALRRGAREIDVTLTPEGSTRLRVIPGKRLRSGTYALTLAYEGTVHEQSYGLYSFEAGGEPYVVTQLEADEARTAWPCFDEPSYKIPWTLSVRRPADDVAISNTPIVRTRIVGDDRIDEFATTEPMPSYAVAVAVGPYVATPVDLRMPSKIWTVKGREAIAESAAKDLPAIVAYLEDWFGTPYPYEKLDLIAVPKFSFGAMENPGAIVYVDRLLFDPQAATPAREHRLIEVSAHEVAHMWFGNLVTLEWWDDFWLNESFAKWMGIQALAELRPDARQDIQRVARLQGMLAYDGTSTARPIRTEINPTAVFESINFAAYPKGEAVLDMVRKWLSEDGTTFQNGIRAYLDKHEWGNATFDDLFAALAEVSGEEIGEPLSAFLDHPGAPLLSVETHGEEVTLRQSRYMRLGEDLEPRLWPIPIRMRVGRPDGSTDIVRTFLTTASTTVDVGEATWVHPAADGMGYWAWVLDEPGLDALLDARDALSPAERRSVWMSLSLGLGSGRLDVGDVLGAAQDFALEPDLAIRSEIVRLANMGSVVGDIDDPVLTERWDAWWRGMLRPWFDELGEPSADEPAAARKLRETLRRELANAGDRSLRRAQLAKARQVLADPTSLPPDEVYGALRVFADDAGVRDYDRLLALLPRIEDPELRSSVIGAAASIDHPRVHDRVFAWALAEDTPVRDYRALMWGLSRNADDALADRIVDWTMDNYDVIVARLPPQDRMNLARTGGGCDLERFERTVPFFGASERLLPGVERALAETRASVERCIRVVEAREPGLRDFLSAPETAAAPR